ncbi:MAG: YciI family protein [Candidatus Dormiibacterota bacterium]
MKLDAYTVAFLRRPHDAPAMSEEELDALQRRHLAFWARLREAGHVVVNGPFIGQPDESLRGVSIFRTSVEEATRMAEQDPSVQAGRLVLEIFTWLMPPGALGDRPAATVQVDSA